MRKVRVYPAAAVAAVAIATQASASDYGCRVLLCLANPAGPTAVSQCVPPITQLWRDLSRVPPRPFPTCDEARPAYAAQTYTYYDPCPEGTTALENGVYAIQQGSDAAIPYVGIGAGDDLMPSIDVTLGSKVCVGRQVGQIGMFWGSGDSGTSALVNVYDRVAILDPATSPRVIDVYLDGTLYRRVRW
jgi:hypothetical protein